MDMSKQVMSISADLWNAQTARGLTAIVNDRPYIVMTHETTHEPVYQSVAILDAGQSRTSATRSQLNL
jgi:hypothetical protein